MIFLKYDPFQNFPIWIIGHNIQSDTILCVRSIALSVYKQRRQIIVSVSVSMQFQYLNLFFNLYQKDALS